MLYSLITPRHIISLLDKLCKKRKCCEAPKCTKSTMKKYKDKSVFIEYKPYHTSVTITVSNGF